MEMGLTIVITSFSFCGMLNSKLQKIVEDLNWFLSQRHTEVSNSYLSIVIMDYIVHGT